MDRFVELSSDLIRDAHAAASLSRRSIAEQIEFWTQLAAC
ncbi:TA system antitoxin ParD family protein [Blastopirellula retiformator]